MQAKGRSKAAMDTAFMRAYHAAHAHSLIFDDFLADSLITEEECLASEERHLKAFQTLDPAQYLIPK
jgi:O-methyltransferase involved in polyketide biosynthesis